MKRLTLKSSIFWDPTPSNPLKWTYVSGENIASIFLRNIGRLHGLHGVMSQNILLFIATAVRPSNPAKMDVHFVRHSDNHIAS